MIRAIKRTLRRKNTYIHDWLIAMKYSFFKDIYSYRNLMIVIPRKSYWLIKSKNGTLFFPKAGLRFPKWNINQKYTYKNFVKVESGDIVCDIGAYIGEFSLSIADKASKVILIEPDPINYRCLRRNTEHLDNIILIKNPLWKENCNLQFILGFPSNDSSLINVDSDTERGRISLQAKRLDTLFFDLKLERIDFLKMDAEGAEPEVLEGAEKIFNKIQKVAIDCGAERKGQPTVKMVQKKLKNEGFNVHIRASLVFGWKKLI